MWIQTFTGKRFDLFDPKPEQVCIEDIARSLAMTARFGGHVNRFYSVAEHSLIVSSKAPRGLKMAALLHDAAEAYIGDIVRPLKRNLWFEQKHDSQRREFLFKPIDDAEDDILAAICKRFSVSLLDLHDSALHEIDCRVLMTEVRQLLTKPPEDWQESAEPYPDLSLSAMSWQEAEQAFLAEFDFQSRWKP